MDRFAVTIVQLARLGDLAQAWPLVDGLRQVYGDRRVGLIVDERLKDLAELMAGRENVVSVAVNDLLKSGARYSTAGWQNFRALRAELVAAASEAVINLNYHSAVAALAETVPAKVRSGARLTDVMLGRPSDEQTAELFRATTGQRKGNRHLSDIWRDYGRFGSQQLYRPLEAPKSVILEGLSILERAGVDSDEQRIGLLPGAGLIGRRWPVENWARLAKSLSRYSRVVMLGSASDREIADDIIRRTGIGDKEIISLCGETSIKDLTGVLMRCRLVIGVDTGPLQLAGIIGRKCLGIYFGSMHHLETGPYGDGNYAVTPDDPLYPCHEMEMESGAEYWANSIDPDCVLDVALNIIDGTPVSNYRSCKTVRSRLSSGKMEWVECPTVTPNLAVLA